jgi:hypothetical protein
MLRRPDIDNILRAAAVLSNHARFVVVGTGAVVITAKHIPAEMMMTAEIDLDADGITDPELISDLIDATIGQGSMFHRTFHYYGDGVSPGTAIMPMDWRSRATEYDVSGGGAVAICPGANDIAVAKLCAGREKDRDWLRVASSPVSPMLSAWRRCCTQTCPKPRLTSVNWSDGWSAWWVPD